ncbi:hypothetical protein [Robertmurraya siralis]|uniref:hypothetical protein n=1 Tax=Robertmurraya siralis TaxID=77777 RepID=UPI000BA56A50|nr:hypothetical protein [Robertmurraya siralis]PAE20442.1 hypothetical protein CHH80_10515 [Bacillus sp. 7504-2]
MYLAKLNFVPKRSDFPINEIERHLREAMSLEKPKSLNRIAEDAGFSTSTANAHFPLLCKEIKSNFGLYKKQLRHQKQKEIETLLNFCLDKETPISLAQFSIESGFTLRTIRKYAPKLSKNVANRFKEYNSYSKIERINSISKEVEVIAMLIRPYKIRSTRNIFLSG